jgi:hypothetical protein
MAARFIESNQSKGGILKKEPEQEHASEQHSRAARPRPDLRISIRERRLVKCRE